jgi:3-phosphoshikimate 1-carboxyvinyltransferase
MNLQLLPSKLHKISEITITGSKSETNRLLLLQALFPEIALKNTSNSDDSEVMLKALSQIFEPTTHNPQPTRIDVHHAGTAMRFLTAYFAIQSNQEVVLTGSSRMKERPINILVEALNSLGAQISYEEKVGFPPIRIKGRELQKSEIDIEANTSSQYISALLLIAPKLRHGLKINLIGEVTSLPYIQMTLELLNEIGVETSFANNSISIKPFNPDYYRDTTLTIESDWSSASYFYSLVALSEIGTAITLSSYKKNSLQGDSVLAEIYQVFGVKTVFNENNSMTISKVNRENHNLQPITYNLKKSPDIAQTIAVTCFGLGLACHLTGLHTLKIKETDRLEALKNELVKLGASVAITYNSISLEPSTFIKENITIKTYQDHRMAMAFAALAFKVSLIIEEAEVVSKSYPDFWNHLESCGMCINKKS